MKNFSLKTVLDVTFVAILIVFAGLVYSTYSRAAMVTQNRQLVANVGSVSDVLEKILSSSVDMETGTRGYTITGDANYLRVYRQGRDNARRWLDSLRLPVHGKALTQEELHRLEELVARKDSVSVATINARRQLGMEAAAAIVRTGRGNQIMDAIRVSVMENQNEALRVLKSSMRITEENVRVRNRNFMLFALVTIVMTIIAYVRLRRMTDQLIKDRRIQENLIDELSLQNQQLNEFASITSHNLRSPAANITALVDAVDDQTTIDEYRSLFDLLRKISVNLNESLGQLVDVLSIRRNALVEKQELSFAETLQKTTDVLQGQMAVANAGVTSDFAVETISYPRIYLESIFHNLISNAIKYGKPSEPPKIHVSTESKGGHILLKVSDNGIGIDLARHGNKIFGMNQRFTHHPDSKGIGLFMTRAQVESMKGRISVESQPGVGTTFTVTFHRQH